MKRHEIVRRLDDIVDFAGVHDFIDTPVKRYSSGMNARLGFAIAAHLDPQVLIVDEVLSVGDVAFQRRCIERMRSFKRSGVTIVFVSHNLQAVNDLCDSTLYIKGSTQALGPTAEVLSQYVAATTSNVASDTDAASILSAEFLGGGRSVVSEPGADVTLRVAYRANRRLTDFHLGFLIYRSTDLLVVYDGNVTDHELGLASVDAGMEFTVDFHFTANLVRGQYHVECHVYNNATQEFLAKLSPAGLIRIEETRTFAGVADIALEPDLIRTPEASLTAAVGPPR
jgi:hypothetical protein